MTRRLFRVGAAFMVLAVCIVVGAWVRGTSPAELVEICRAAVCAKTGKATVAERVAAIAEKIASDCREFGLKNIIVHYIGAPDEAKRWAREVIEPLCGCEVAVAPVSPCIGLHVGPAVGVAYECAAPLPGKLSAGMQVPVHSF